MSRSHVIFAWMIVYAALRNTDFFQINWKMNIFRLLGDLSHLLAIIILLLKIWKTRSCAGKWLKNCGMPACRTTWRCYYVSCNFRHLGQEPDTFRDSLHFTVLGPTDDVCLRVQHCDEVCLHQRLIRDYLLDVREVQGYIRPQPRHLQDWISARTVPSAIVTNQSWVHNYGGKPCVWNFCLIFLLLWNCSNYYNNAHVVHKK